MSDVIMDEPRREEKWLSSCFERSLSCYYINIYIYIDSGMKINMSFGKSFVYYGLKIMILGGQFNSTDKIKEKQQTFLFLA